jgi:hypothetical protein
MHTNLKPSCVGRLTSVSYIHMQTLFNIRVYTEATLSDSLFLQGSVAQGNRFRWPRIQTLVSPEAKMCGQ